MFRLTFVSLLLMTAVNTVDVTGTWAGQISRRDDSGQAVDGCYLILRQVDQVVTGTAGPDENHQIPIANGKVEGDTISFVLSTGQGSMSFEITTTGDQLDGWVKMTRDSDTEVGKFSAKRKQPN
jgi:hypothetical protein